jgi:hypothetical protein
VVVAVDHQVAVGDRCERLEHAGHSRGVVEAVELVDLQVHQQHAVRCEVLREASAEGLVDLEHSDVVAQSPVQRHVGEHGRGDALRQVGARGIGEHRQPMRPKDAREHMGRRGLAVRTRHEHHAERQVGHRARQEARAQRQQHTAGRRRASATKAEDPAREPAREDRERGQGFDRRRR